MRSIDAFHLPGLSPDEVDAWEVRAYPAADFHLRFPRLDAPTLRQVCDRLVEARASYLPDCPLDRLTRAIDGAAARLADPDHPLRRTAEEVLPAVTGYAPAMVRLVLDHMCTDWRAPALEQLLHRELGADGRALRDFVPGPTDAVRAMGPRLAFHIFAGNVPGVAVTSLVRSLLVGAATLGKTASGEPLLPVLFARALADQDPQLAECLAVTYWPGGNQELEDVAYRAADAIVVYGGEATLAAVRRRAPASVRILDHGPRLSLALLTRESLADVATARATAHAAARATAIFDQQGCVSPHACFAEAGGGVTPRQFAHLLAEALSALQEELPRGRISGGEAAAIQEYRAAAEFRLIAGRETELFTGPGTSYTVVYQDAAELLPSCLNRTIAVHPLVDPAHFAELVAPYRHLLQSLAIAGPEQRRRELANRFADLGFTRFTNLDRLPWPPPHGHHDGRGPLRELIRWVDLESA